MDESSLVHFKTNIENPCLYAIGIKNSPGPIPRPMLPLQCAIFCLYKKYEEQNLSVRCSYQDVRGIAPEDRHYGKVGVSMWGPQN